MKTSVKILFFFVISLLFACNKINNQFVVGNNKINVKVTEYDTVISGHYNSSSTFNLDINNNGLEDISFVCGVSGSPGYGQHPFIQLISLNDNVLFYGNYMTETTFLSIDSITDTSNPTLIHIVKNQSCYRFTPNDSIVDIEEIFSLITLKNGETINDNSSFGGANSNILLTPSYGYIYDSFYQLGGVSYEVYDNFNSNCNSLPENEFIYVVVKFKDTLKLAWIKFMIINSSNLYLLETGVQL